MAKFYTPTKLSENIRETPEGFLLCLAVPIARTGWQVYADGETPLEVGKDGTVRVYRDAEEVFRPKTIASFQGKSVTIKHPTDFVGPDNWGVLSKGSAQNVRRCEELDEDGEEILLADLLITEKLAIGLVKNGLREVSCGYEAEYEQTGEGEGRQFNIIGNHIALVEEGRAGQSYAINDHKGKVNMDLKLIAKLKKKFGAKVVDAAIAEEKKEPAKDAGAFDEISKMVTDLQKKIADMGKPAAKDEEPEGEKEKPKKKEKEKPAAEDADEEESEDAEGESSVEDRLTALETAVAKLLEGGAEEEESEDSEEEETESEDSEEESEEEESEDSKEKEESSLTGDTAARVEIIAPGTKVAKGMDVRVKALETAYATKEGKAIINAFTGGKKPVFDSAEKISTLFIATSEIMKASRGTGLERTKDAARFKDHGDSEGNAEPMTAEKMNEINAAQWAGKKGN